MIQLPFAKVESIGNDFVLMDEHEVAQRLSEPVDWSAIAQQVCARRTSVGSDGLLVVGRRGRDLTQRMFNPDGTGDFCGNGLRCTAQYGFEKGWVDAHFEIWHLGRSIPVHLQPEGRIAMSFDRASFAADDLPAVAGGEIWDWPWRSADGHTWAIHSLSTGSTHTILFVPELPESPEFERVSAELEVDPLFPRRTSVIWTVLEGRHRLRIRIWERGVGETWGCGTGSSAAVIAAIRLTGDGGDYVVANPGGEVTVSAKHWNEPFRVSGQARVVFEGEVWITLGTHGNALP